MPTQSASELRSHLNEQLMFMRSSARAFDDRKFAEAKRLATSLRILLHETRMSHALLGQLSLLSTMQFFDSTKGTGSLTILVREAGQDPRYAPFLDDPPPRCGQGQWLPFDRWWTLPVIRMPQASFCRRDLVLEIANTDGGAHVGELKDFYSRLSRSKSFGGFIFMVDGEPRPTGNPVLASIRQVTHEVDRSISQVFPSET